LDIGRQGGGDSAFIILVIRDYGYLKLGKVLQAQVRTEIELCIAGSISLKEIGFAVGRDFLIID